MFPSENYFFQLLAYAKDHKQKRNITKFINKSQLNTLKQISKKILNGEIPLNNVQYRGLERRKLFLRRLSKGKIRNTDLLHNFITVCYIVKISLKHYEKCPKISSRTCGKVGKIGDNIPVKQVSVTSVTQKNVSHPTNPTSQVMKAKLKVKNQKGLGKQQVMKKTQMFHFLTQ